MQLSILLKRQDLISGNRRYPEVPNLNWPNNQETFTENPLLHFSKPSAFVRACSPLDPVASSGRPSPVGASLASWLSSPSRPERRTPVASVRKSVQFVLQFEQEQIRGLLITVCLPWLYMSMYDLMLLLDTMLLLAIYIYTNIYIYIAICLCR